MGRSVRTGPVESLNATLESNEHTMIPRNVFNHWLYDPQMLATLEEADIETSTKLELFDVLDVDMGGELGLDELIGGLMRLRGPISKTDVVAIRLKVRYMTKLVEDIWHKFVGEGGDSLNVGPSNSNT